MGYGADSCGIDLQAQSMLWADRHRGSVTVLYQPRREGGVECMALSSFESGRPGNRKCSILFASPSNYIPSTRPKSLLSLYLLISPPHLRPDLPTQSRLTPSPRSARIQSPSLNTHSPCPTTLSCIPRFSTYSQIPPSSEPGWNHTPLGSSLAGGTGKRDWRIGRDFEGWIIIEMDVCERFGIRR